MKGQALKGSHFRSTKPKIKKELLVSKFSEKGIEQSALEWRVLKGGQW